MKSLVYFLSAMLAVSGAYARETVLNTRAARGYIAVVNRQTKVSETELIAASEIIRNDVLYVFRFVKSEAEAKQAAMQLEFVDQINGVPMTASPETHKVVVNVAALSPDIKSESSMKKFLPLRVKKMFLRAFCYAAGAGGSAFPGNILDIISVRDLDYCEAFIPMDTYDVIKRHLEKMGIEPEEIVSYDQACQEGWAPVPTNEAQKVIWEKIHTPPKTPMKIEFDPKKGR